MNIRGVIEKLQEMAERLPDGLDSEVQVHICNQDEPGVMTASIEVDTMWTYNQKTGALIGGFAIVQGHPHRDKGTSTTKPVTAEIDDLVEQWAADLRGVDAGGASRMVTMTSPKGEKYLLLPSSDGKFVKLALTDGALRYPPGSPHAVEAGCICDPERNNFGRGRGAGDAVQMIIKDGCPLHPKIEGPLDPDSE
ncbi:MAG: hypothetical protein ACRDRA_16690 [Pseudonocardiaceae bacterium]